MLPDGWDGGYEHSTLDGPSRLRLHPAGECFSVVRRWDEARHEIEGWYVNLEQPWVRTPIGFDSHDDVLDILVADDLSEWSWKDADELEWSVSAGRVTADYAECVGQTGTRVAAMIEAREWPFREEAWGEGFLTS